MESLRGPNQTAWRLLPRVRTAPAPSEAAPRPGPQRASLNPPENPSWSQWGTPPERARGPPSCRRPPAPSPCRQQKSSWSPECQSWAPPVLPEKRGRGQLQPLQTPSPPGSQTWEAKTPWARSLPGRSPWRARGIPRFPNLRASPRARRSVKISLSSSDARVSRAAWGLWCAYGSPRGVVTPFLHLSGRSLLYPPSLGTGVPHPREALYRDLPSGDAPCSGPFFMVEESTYSEPWFSAPRWRETHHHHCHQEQTPGSVSLSSLLQALAGLEAWCATLHPSSRRALASALGRRGRVGSSRSGFQRVGSSRRAVAYQLSPALRLSPFITHPSPQALLRASHPSPGPVVSGIPKPDVTWFLDGVPVRSQQGTIEVYEAGGAHYLCLRRARARDSGDYSCTAANVRGQVSCHWTLLVKSEYVPQGHPGFSVGGPSWGASHMAPVSSPTVPCPGDATWEKCHSCLPAKVKVIAPREWFLMGIHSRITSE